MLQVRWEGYDKPTWEPEANMCAISMLQAVASVPADLPQNRTGCPEELDAYYKSINGRPTFQKKGRSAPGKRASTGTAAAASASTSTPTSASGNRGGRGKRKTADTEDSPAPASAAAPEGSAGGKRGRKRAKTGTDTDGPDASAKFIPPAGSWEDALLRIEAMEREPDGRVSVMVEWRSGERTKHKCEMLHNKAPKLVSLWNTKNSSLREDVGIC